MEKLNLTQEWDKVFPKSDKGDHKKVTFPVSFRERITLSFPSGRTPAKHLT